MSSGESAGGGGGGGVRTVSGGFIAALCQPIREKQWRKKEKHVEGQRKESAQISEKIATNRGEAEGEFSKSFSVCLLEGDWMKLLVVHSSGANQILPLLLKSHRSNAATAF